MKLPIPHKTRLFLCCKNHLLCTSCLSKEGHIPKVAPNSQAGPPGRQPGEPEGHVQTRIKTTASHFLLRPWGKCLLALRDSSTWWEGWCEWRRKPVWEGGTEKSVWVSRRRGQLSQISSLSPLFKNMTNPWLQWIYIQWYCVGIKSRLEARRISPWLKEAKEAIFILHTFLEAGGDLTICKAQPFPICRLTFQD